MKKKLQQCSICGEETWHDVGKKQAHSGDAHYTKRTTSRCRKCGTREVVNKQKGRHVFVGKNELPSEEE